MAKEISSLTEMGTITHLHSAAALKAMGIDIETMPAAHTHVVFDNKIKPDAVTLKATLEKLKSRMVVDGGPRDDQTRALRRDFQCDAKVGNVQADSNPTGTTQAGKPMLRCLECFWMGCAGEADGATLPAWYDQFDRVTGQRLYMALWLNTFGTPDGGNIWQGERNKFIKKHFNKGPWTVKKCFMDQCMFYFNYNLDR